MGRDEKDTFICGRSYWSCVWIIYIGVIIVFMIRVGSGKEEKSSSFISMGQNSVQDDLPSENSTRRRKP